MIDLRNTLLLLLCLCVCLGSASADLLLGGVSHGPGPDQVPAGVTRLLGAPSDPAGDTWSVAALLGPPDLALTPEQVAHTEAEGLCLLAFCPGGEAQAPDAELLAAFSAQYGRRPRPAPFDGVDGALLAGLKAERVGRLLSGIREQAPSLKLALACDADDLTAYSATALGLDVPGYLGAGLLDEVMVRCSQPRSLMALKLATDREVTVWAWCSALDATGLRGAIAAALRCPGVDGLMLDAPLPLEEMVTEAKAAEARYADLRQRQERLAEAVANGDLVPAAGTELSGELDQATIHEVAQSFTVDKDTQATAVGIVACLRGPAGAALPELPLTLRTDAGGKPSDEVLATALLYPDGLSAEPGYRWTYVELDKPAALQAGKTYWLHGPEVTAQGSWYMWRVRKGDAYPGGQAWSSKYDYSKVDWVFGVLGPKEQP